MIIIHMMMDIIYFSFRKYSMANNNSQLQYEQIFRHASRVYGTVRRQYDIDGTYDTRYDRVPGTVR